MFIAVDDTDSRSGNCTTYLATEIVRSLNGYDLIGNPRLVRLNPAVPWKTRGNASIVLRVGIGTGKKKKIGEIGGKDIFCYEKSSGEPDAEKLLNEIIPVVMVNREPDAESGVIVSSVKPDVSFYKLGVQTILTLDPIKKEAERINAKVFTMDTGIGLIGALCGMAWEPKDSTYELLAYRKKERWGTERSVESKTIRLMDSKFTGTFNSWEERYQKVTMVPSTPCPVLYGIRGDIEEELPSAHATIKSEGADRWIIFLTNQGTDDHIITDARELIPDQSYLIKGTVAETARRLKGGHVFMDIDTKYGKITCGAYEPSKEFRMLFDNLLPGDTIEVMGELREDPRTLNVEKVHVTSTIKAERKVSNPICPKCDGRMKSVGKGQGYRCKKCHTKSKEPDMEMCLRSVVPGWYEPPAAARRHLSKPLKRMHVEQPVEFVNQRSE